jgi:hypothetical protein
MRTPLQVEVTRRFFLEITQSTDVRWLDSMIARCCCCFCVLLCLSDHSRAGICYECEPSAALFIGDPPDVEEAGLQDIARRRAQFYSKVCGVGSWLAHLTLAPRHHSSATRVAAR